MIKSNCHTHSLYCDGNNTIEEMVLAAIDRGFVSLGFSGHGPMNFASDWAMSDGSFRKYIDEVNELKNKYKGKIDILCGVELDADHTDIDLNELDYYICSVHQFRKGEKDYPIDYSADALADTVAELFAGDWYAMCKEYYSRLTNFVNIAKPDVVGHFDLVTKYNEGGKLFDESDPEYRNCAVAALESIVDSNPNIIFEVNTGTMYRQGNMRPYPAPFVMEYLKHRNIKITVTTDSHCTESLDFAYNEAVEYCRSFGFDKLNILTSDGWKETEI